MSQLTPTRTLSLTHITHLGGWGQLGHSNGQDCSSPRIIHPKSFADTLVCVRAHTHTLHTCTHMHTLSLKHSLSLSHTHTIATASQMQRYLLYVCVYVCERLTCVVCVCECKGWLYSTCTLSPVCLCVCVCKGLMRSVCMWV